ncbi:MAG: hypothetical protein ACRD6B_08635 [Bryobacteraceae bacterium]
MISHAEVAGRPCWPIIWLWTLSIAQYSYRYILHVNDPHTTTNFYAATPPLLSAIKYAILLLFILYAAWRFLRTPIWATPAYRMVAQMTAFGILLLLVILLVRIAIFPGDLADTYLFAIQFLPWMATALLIPFFADRKHSVIATLLSFERIAFWVTFPFWLITVVLALAGIRYPALSYPGVILRFGGILDDPNGYACLCLLLMMIAFGTRRGAWVLRMTVYVLMLLGTLSLSGYITAGVIGAILLFLKIYRTKQSAARWLLLTTLACGVAFTAFAVLPTVYNVNHAFNALGGLYSTKRNSAAVHISDLLPAENTLQAPSLSEILVGTGGFSENLYWRTLANFGVIGLLIVAGLALMWLCAGWSIRERWRRTFMAWNLGVLIGSNGISFLSTFPLGLIFWSGLALMVHLSRGGERAS